jgi:hypothetical protein
MKEQKILRQIEDEKKKDLLVATCHALEQSTLPRTLQLLGNAATY